MEVVEPDVLAEAEAEPIQRPTTPPPAEPPPTIPEPITPPVEPPPAPPPVEPPPAPPPVEERGRYRDGTYEGTGYYAFGTDKYPLTIQINVEQGYIRRLAYLAFPTSDLVKDESFLNPMRDQLLDRQDANIDTISGATGTSDAFLTAIRDALSKAG